MKITWQFTLFLHEKNTDLITYCWIERTYFMNEKITHALEEKAEDNHTGLVVFSFYSSFWEAGKNLKDKDRLAFYDALLDYCFLGKEPEFSGVLAAVFAIARPNVDASNRRRLAGSTGGKVS